jgi:cold shock CspA family protein
MQAGTVKSFNAREALGLIQPAFGGENVFVDIGYEGKTATRGRNS